MDGEKLSEAELLAIILRVGQGTFKTGVRGKLTAHTTQPSGVKCVRYSITPSSPPRRTPWASRRLVPMGRISCPKCLQLIAGSMSGLQPGRRPPPSPYMPIRRPVDAVVLEWYYMPRKVRKLIRDLERAGFVNRGGKGSHRNYLYPRGVRITVSGHAGDDAKRYQERDVEDALREAQP